MNKRKQRNRRTAGKILIIAGSFIIIFVITINLIDLIKSTIAIDEFKKRPTQVVIERIDENGTVASQGDLEVVSGTLDSASVQDEDADDKAAMCLLRISKIKLEEAVKEGSTRGVLSSALGHMENTALPGEDGNCCIAGHRNYVFGKYFNRLGEVTPGDVIELETKDNIYEYEVVSIEVVEPEDVSVLDYAEGKNLTLITCTPFMVGTHRLIVHAVMK
ncbi:MAG: class D sortase [Lachnospiraceae bacterium]|nr:class D sortase [Candidatus Colinaster scatohippi]